MRPNGTLVGSRFGPISAIRPQPRRQHENEVWVGTPTSPWGARKLPSTLFAGDPRRTLFRTLLRRAEGVSVELADGEGGTVEEVVFGVLGFDFWPQELLVETPTRRLRVPVDQIQRIDVHQPRIVVGPTRRRPLEANRRREQVREHARPSRRDRAAAGLRQRRNREASVPVR